jgi:hypothetical protein
MIFLLFKMTEKDPKLQETKSNETQTSRENLIL